MEAKLANGMKEDYWYLNGKAYDFEPFVSQHPGGEWALMLGKGRDCTALFQSYHPKLPSSQLVEKYRISSEDLPDEFKPLKKISFAEDGFYATVKRETMKHFKEQNKDWKAPWTHKLAFVLNVIFQLVAYYYMISRASYLFAAVHGIFRALMTVRSTHASSHFSFSRSPTVNRWVYRIGTVMIALWPPTTWDLQHVVAHHIYTNEWPYDSDSGFPIKSIFPNQRRYSFHKYQHIYMWFLYGLMIPLIMLNAIREVIQGHQMAWSIKYNSPNARLEAVVTIIGMVTYLIFPLFFLPVVQALFLIAFSAVISSLIFSLQFVVNHEVDGIVGTTVGDSAPPGQDILPPATPADHSIDWGKYQMLESHTFAPCDRFALELAGGLNTQIEHHLFPGVHYSHYMAVTPIIQRVAKEFNIPYFSTPNLFSAIAAHYRLLKYPLPSSRANIAAPARKKVQ